jgi:glycosyltransferase involved in cell wall biosynthesis
LKPIIQKLENEFPIEFHVISDKSPEFNDLKSFKFIQWSKENEVDAMLHFSVGVMPLVEDLWSQGKCGFKALQYMSIGVPAVVSPVGVNKTIVKQGFNGFICHTEDEWYDTLKNCILNQNLLESLGANARKTIESTYSVDANSQNFLELFG